ncbi:MAG TPA: MG2 domain-containing protein [Candidatus Limnocylindrales bacterium]|nr:MG2 domain-containing protein [Candidatus Limnocylindrales bacterium]
MTALYNNIRETANTTYKVKYNVSVSVPQASFNKNNSVPVNITVYDRSLVPVPGAYVNSTVTISNQYFTSNGTTDENGMFNYRFNNTSIFGKYNITVNVSKDNSIGNSNTSFRISNLTVTANSKPEYNASNTVVINGTVFDDETGTKVTGAIVNVTLNNGSSSVFKNTTTSAGNYSVSFANLSAGVYTARVDVTYTMLSGGAAGAFHIHYYVNTSINRAFFSVGEVVPINITLSDVNGKPAVADISVNIRKPDSSNESIYGSTVNGFFNTAFTNSSLEGDYTISASALNASTSAHGDAVNSSFRASGFFVNASFDRDPVSYRPGEMVIISGLLRDTLGAARRADVRININNSYGVEIANTTLYNSNGSYVWNYTLSKTAIAGWYMVNVNALTPEGAQNSAAAQFEVQLTITAAAKAMYNPGDMVNVSMISMNGTVKESTRINVTVQKFDIWNDFTGTYFDSGKIQDSYADVDKGYYLNRVQKDTLQFYSANLPVANTWVGKAVRLNTSSLPTHFILDYEVMAGGSSSYLIARPTLGNVSNYVSLNLYNYSDNSQDGYYVSSNESGTWTMQYSKKENTDNKKVRLSIEYDAGMMRFYTNGEQFYQFNYTLPLNSFIKLNAYARTLAQEHPLISSMTMFLYMTSIRLSWTRGSLKGMMETTRSISQQVRSVCTA